MKSLFLLRHAKSSWGDARAPDFERVLNERGRRDAPRVGEYLRSQKIELDLIVSSPAARARETIELVRASSGIDGELRFDERIYEASVSRLLEVVAGLDERAQSALLVGHNPGMQELIEALTGEGRHVPTAALARIELDISRWSEVSSITRAAGNRLTLFVAPKDIQ